ELRRLSERYQLQIEELQTLLQASELRLRLIEENLQLGNKAPIFLRHPAEPNRPLLIGNRGLIALWICGVLALHFGTLVRKLLRLPLRFLFSSEHV
ncbi:MAG: hypothetical protein OIF58_07075, partial [Cohaesibacter sp.]|nr:hypothetical protein [Cohaesibacter sp.]